MAVRVEITTTMKKPTTLYWFLVRVVQQMRAASTGKQAGRVAQEILIYRSKSKYDMTRGVRCTIGGGTQGSPVETRRCGGVLEVMIEL